MVCGPRDESAIEVDHPQEPLELFDGRGRGKLPDCSHSFLEGLRSCSIHSVSEKVKGRYTKNTLGPVHNEAICGQHLEDVVKILKMFFWRRGGNEDVVDVDKAVWNSIEDRVHESLEILTRILKSKGGPLEDIESKWGDDSSLLDVVGMNRDLMVPFEQVDFAEDGLSSEVL